MTKWLHWAALEILGSDQATEGTGVSLAQNPASAQYLEVQPQT